MSSKLFFDPMTLFRVAPLVTASFSVCFSWDQQFFLQNFLHPTTRSKIDGILPAYFDTFFRAGLPRILVLFTTSTALGIANAVTGKPNTSRFYVAGAVLSAAHYLFVPWVMYPIRAIVHDESHGRSSEDLEKWLGVHTTRTLLVDVPAWACFFLAILGAVRAV